jgi:hypothetical protein
MTVAEAAEPPDLSELTVFRLAREIARDLLPLDTICENYKITEEQYQRVLHSTIFQRRLEEELEIWNASTPMAAVERIKLKAGAMIEEALPEVYAMLHDKNQPLAAKIRALEWASKMAGIGEVVPLGALPPGVASGGGSGLTFNIYIGGQKQTYQQADVQPKVVEGEAVLVDKQPVP